MKATRKKEYAERKQRKATAHEISEMNLSRHNEKKANRKEILVPIGKGLWRVDYV